MGGIDQSGGPGFVGFVITFALTGVCILLFLSMSRHLRKVRHDAESGAVDRDARGDVVADKARDR